MFKLIIRSGRFTSPLRSVKLKIFVNFATSYYSCEIYIYCWSAGCWILGCNVAEEV
jgi:hypothetical protein